MAEVEPLNPFRTVVDLNGEWDRYIHRKLFDRVVVPSSLRPSGTYRLQRTFLLPHLTKGARAILHFEAITYFGRVFLNGTELGNLIPYLPHEFECATRAAEGRNTIEVEIVNALVNRMGKAEMNSDSEIAAVGNVMAESFALYTSSYDRPPISILSVSATSLPVTTGAPRAMHRLSSVRVKGIRAHVS